MKIISFCLFIFVITLASCSKDDDPNDELFVCTPEVSYSADVSPIFKNTCALSGCHVSGFAGGNFNEYDDIKDRINLIVNNVFVFETMPPNNTPGPMELTQEELDILDCWIGNGAPNN